MKLGPGLAHLDDAEGHGQDARRHLINFQGTIVYHLGDTALFSDLALVGKRRDEIDVALMCIGGHYTMDR